MCANWQRDYKSRHYRTIVYVVLNIKERDAIAHQQWGTSALFYYSPTVIFSCKTYSRGVGIWYDLEH
jgi:hypothetical protein